jgi:hypothetical protein
MIFIEQPIFISLFPLPALILLLLLPIEPAQHLVQTVKSNRGSQEETNERK